MLAMMDVFVCMYGRGRRDGVDEYHPSMVDEQTRALMHTGRVPTWKAGRVESEIFKKRASSFPIWNASCMHALTP